MLSIYGKPQRLCSGVSRRELLTIGALGLGGLALPDLLRAETPQGRAQVEEGDHHDLHVRRAAAPGHVRSEDGRAGRDSRRVPADRHERAGHSKSASTCRGWRGSWTSWCRFARSYGSPNGDHDSFICYTGRSCVQQPPGGWPSVGSTLSKLLGRADRRHAAVRRPVAEDRASAVRLARAIRVFSARRTARFARTAKAGPI